MLSRRMNSHAARALRWLAAGGEFEGESLLQAAWEWREFSTDMGQMELAACSREELFDPPKVAGDPPVRVGRVAAHLHSEWEIAGKIQRTEMMGWTADLLDLAAEVNDFETRRSPRAPVTPDIAPKAAGNVVRLVPQGKPGGRRGNK